jgi:hypothetical protein
MDSKQTSATPWKLAVRDLEETRQLMDGSKRAAQSRGDVGRNQEAGTDFDVEHRLTNRGG